MSITKEFNNFIAKAFNGLSSKTLVQELTITSYHIPADIAADLVYVHIFHVFTRTATLEDMEIFQTIQDWILHIDRTEVESIQREIAELKYCIEYGYKYPSIAYIKENALEWYLNHIITLSDFIYVTYIYTILYKLGATETNSVSRKEINYEKIYHEKIYHYCHHYGSYLYHYNNS